MNLQDVVWAIALGGIGLVALGFILVIAQAAKPADADAMAKSAQAARKWQGRWFWALVVIFVVGSWTTLRPYPIAPQGNGADGAQVVTATGYQWVWQIQPTTIQAGVPTEFRVTSADVNHGFAIYAPDGRIVAQTQAMPGYTNKLLHTFTEPGAYEVQCLEFCGIGHAPMRTTIQVVAGGGR